jgi:hypothetical protein
MSSVPARRIGRQRVAGCTLGERQEPSLRDDVATTVIPRGGRKLAIVSRPDANMASMFERIKSGRFVQF